MNSANTILLYGGVITAVFLIISLLIKEKTERARLFLFWGMSSVIIFVTMFITLDTVFKNIDSVTKGPVHWHADFQIWGCEQRLDIVDPSGLANRVGTPVLHEHDDERIHVEGTVQQLADVNLQSFFRVIGGELTQEKLTLPTNEGLATFENGQRCPDGTAGLLQVFRYETKGDKIYRAKLENFTEYIPAPESVVPPGDCIIVEFGQEKQQTDRICNFYQIDLDKGDLTYGN